MTRRSAALAAALVVAGCGRPDPTFELPAERGVLLTLTIGDTVSFREQRPAKSLQLALRGTPRSAADGALLTARIVRAELTYRDSEGGSVTLATDGLDDAPERATELQRARRGLLEALLGHDVTLSFRAGTAAQGGGLRAVDGLAAALQDAAAAVGSTTDVDAAILDAALGGLEALCEDADVERALRGAGLAAADPAMRSNGGEVRRDVLVRVDGRGVLAVTAFGRAGQGDDGSPTVRLEGHGDEAAAFAGDPGQEPPPGVGPVRVGEVSVVASTEYEAGSFRPRRGSLVVELPHGGGPLVRRSVEFVLLVTE